MGVQSSMSSKVLLRLVIGVLTIISLEGWVAAKNVTYGSCKPADCDDVRKPCCRPELPPLKIEPFWEQLAGYDFQSLKLISEFERTGNACFAPLLPFPVNLAFLRNCTNFPNGDYPHHDSICPSDWTDDSYVALMLGRPEDLHVNWSGCASHTIVPVILAGEDRERMEDEHFEEKAKQGITLVWNLPNWRVA